ncbi:ankyrin repeat-containing domain protein [Penicillium angulare]|uniref:Ankyrin repeat-containing domain protein n=1 Tax=Penicillium angulare TaxID=116970 RepID=A0A9W9EKM8_9EURO|nr:ankyrin repeat-containing domain protein [Penicillium angulare]
MALSQKLTESRKGQYEYKFREWGLKKYPMGAAEWKYIKRQMETRKRESGKDSEVYINGVLQSPKKVRYEIGRQGFESTIAKFQEGLSCIEPFFLDPVSG